MKLHELTLSKTHLYDYNYQKKTFHKLKSFLIYIKNCTLRGKWQIYNFQSHKLI